jgi:hypothetical protein
VDFVIRLRGNHNNNLTAQHAHSDESLFAIVVAIILKGHGVFALNDQFGISRQVIVF